MNIQALFVIILTALSTICSAMDCTSAITDDLFLGQGSFSYVYKHKLTKNTYVLHKVYYRDGGGYPEDFSMLSILKDDVKKLQTFSRLFKSASLDFRSVEVIDVLDNNKYNIFITDERREMGQLAPTLVLEYIEGVSIYDLVEAIRTDTYPYTWLNKDKAIQIINQYNNTIYYFYSYLLSREPIFNIYQSRLSSETYDDIFIDSEPISLYSLDISFYSQTDYEETSNYLSISTDNMIVNSNGDFVLVDPF